MHVSPRIQRSRHNSRLQHRYGPSGVSTRYSGEVGSTCRSSTIFFTRLFVKLSGHSGITQSTPSPVLGFDIAFTLPARWQPQGDSLRSKNACKLKIGKVQDYESAGVAEALAHAFRWGFCDPEDSRPLTERGRGIHRLGVRKMVSPQSFGAHIC